MSAVSGSRKTTVLLLHLHPAGSVNGVAGIEMVMNRIAHELNMDPWEVRRVNFAFGHGSDPK